MARVVIETLALIDAPAKQKRPRFCAGVVLWDDKVIEAAPIVQFMRRWSRDDVRRHCAANGWTISVVTESKRMVD